MSFEDEYRKLMEKPIEEIKEDISSVWTIFNMNRGMVNLSYFWQRASASPQRNTPCKSARP